MTHFLIVSVNHLFGKLKIWSDVADVTFSRWIQEKRQTSVKLALLFLMQISYQFFALDQAYIRYPGDC